MKFAFADPPYYGTAKKFYGDATYDSLDAHAQLIARLCSEYPDGWAMCLHSPSLRLILPLCPPETRVGAWVKPFCSFKPGVNPAYAWEPVLFLGGRKREPEAMTVRDWTSCNITLRKGLTGAKPDGFCYWVFDLLGAQEGDEVHDLFPGTGAVTRAWRAFTSQGRLAIR